MVQKPSLVGAHGDDTLNAEARAVAEALSSRAIAPGVVASFSQGVEFLLLVLLGGILLLTLSRDLSLLGWDAAAAVVLVPFVTVLFVRSGGGYTLSALAHPVSALARVLFVWSIVILLVAASRFLLGPEFVQTRLWLVSFLILGSALLILERSLAVRWIRRLTEQGRLERRAVIVGGGEDAKALIDALASEKANGIHVCGIFDDRNDERSPDSISGYPKLGTVAELVQFSRIARADLVIVSLPMSAERRLLEILRALWVLPVDIRLSALGSRLRFRPRAYSYIGAVPFLDLVDRPIAGWRAFWKRAFDLVLTVLGLIVLSPVMLLAAIAIRLESPGPILFRQKRYGFNNEVIDVLKFRSMYHHLSDPFAKVAVTKDDPRVTRVGRILRRTSIDELPQFFNVLKGQLSLVGPRPHAVNAHTDNRLWDEVVDGYFARHKVKPGITGWAQINGWRGEIDTPEKILRRVECDLEYIDRWSLLFDLYILALTPLSLIRTETAY